MGMGELIMLAPEKTCETCGKKLEYLTSGHQELRDPPPPRDEIYRCPDGHEVWTFEGPTSRWRKHKGDI
jgi:hypothetical protein